jgi:hypothetical protein
MSSGWASPDKMEISCAVIQKGDRVLVKEVSFDGKHKLADTWEKVPYVVVDQANSEIPVFTVIREDGEGRTRILHITRTLSPFCIVAPLTLMLYPSF